MFKKILLILAGLTTALIIAELFFRKFYPQITYAKADAFSFPCFEEDQYRWIKLKSNADCTLKSYAEAFPDIAVKTNSLGLRNPEISKEKQANKKRILFVGDSFTMGWGVDEEKTYPRVVESELKAASISAETINAGFAAAGPSGYYLYIKNYALDLNPDLVVIGFFLGNDISARKDVEWTEVDPSGLPLQIRSKTTYVDSSGKLRFRHLPIKYGIPILREFHLYVFLMDKIFQKKNQYLGKESAFPQICLFKEWCHDMDTSKEEIKKLFLATKKILDSKNIKLLVVVIPAEYQVYDGIEYKYSLPTLLPTNKSIPNKEFGSFFESNGIDYIDLLPVFIQNNDKQLYFAADDHWNEEGHKVATEKLVEKLSWVLR